MAIQITNYQCPACTGPLHFVGESGKLECDYCGSSFDVTEIEALYAEKEQKAAEATEAAEAAKAISSYSSCPSFLPFVHALPSVTTSSNGRETNCNVTELFLSFVLHIVWI